MSEMPEELDKLLVVSFPKLYRNRYASPQVTCMCWGFPKRGWFQLIWDLSEKLEKLIPDVAEDPNDSICAFQVKEKFGTLRYYMSHYTDEMRTIINEAEKASAYICEDCGAPGTLRNISWIKTLCDKCALP